MNEVKVYGSLVLALLVGSYFSYSRQDPDAPGADKPTILDAQKGDIRALEYASRTATTSVTFKKDASGKEYAWFVVDQNGHKRSFVANDAFAKTLESFAPFKGLRSLGRLSETELKATGLDRPERKLVLGLAAGARSFEMGGRTSGARDHYVRAKGQSEVFLVASSQLGDLEFPEGRFMQRRLREEPLTNISKVQLESNGKSKILFHKNRLSPNESFWASESTPEEKNETGENYVDKLDKLTVLEYAAEGSEFPRNGTPILVVTWFGEDENKAVNTTEIWKAGAATKTEYYAISPATHVPVKLSTSPAEQIERDLASVVAN